MMSMNKMLYKLNYAARYAKIIPGGFFIKKKNQSRTISTLFLRNSTQKSRKKNMSMHIKFIKVPVL